MRALCTGITGQVGSYLAEILLDKGYEVHGIRRRKAVDNLENLQSVLPHINLQLHWGDTTDGARMAELMYEIKPDIVFHLAAQSQVRIAFDTPVDTLIETGVAAASLLHLTHKFCPEAKFYQASSSEMYGTEAAPQNEETPMVPISPYSAAKLMAYNMVKIYRKAYGMYATNGIVFNCDSPRRGTQFVTRKIAKGVAEIAAGKRDKLVLGNLDARRDWTYAKETAQGIYDMMRLPEPTDMVLGTGETHSVEEFVEEAFKVIGKDWHDYVTFDERLIRPNEVHELRADPTKARQLIRWQPTVNFKDLVQLMVNAEIARL